MTAIPPSSTPQSTVQHELRMRHLMVEAVERPHPGLARVTLGGADMEGFISTGCSDHVKVFFPEEGSSTPDVPELGSGGIKPDPDRPRPRGRDYTPKHERLAEGKLVLDLVLHGPADDSTSAGSNWARRAKVGDTLGIAGPRGSHVLTRHIDGLVLVGDETALPAIRNYVEWASPAIEVVAFIEIGDSSAIEPFAERPGLSVHWLDRNGAAPGTSDALVNAVRMATLPEGRVFYWVAAEAAVAQSVRRCLLDEHGVLPSEDDKAWLESRGYWKRGAVDHQEAHDD